MTFMLNAGFRDRRDISNSLVNFDFSICLFSRDRRETNVRTDEQVQSVGLIIVQEAETRSS